MFATNMCAEGVKSGHSGCNPQVRDGNDEIPLFQRSKGIKRAVFGGWQAQLIVLFQSGRRLAPWTLIGPEGVHSFSGPKTPEAYDFNGYTINAASARQN